MPAQPPRYGTEITRHEPVFVDDGEGGLRFRVITDDDEVFHGKVSRQTAARIVMKLVPFVAKGEHHD